MPLNIDTILSTTSPTITIQNPIDIVLPPDSQNPGINFTRVTPEGAPSSVGLLFSNTSPNTFTSASFLLSKESEYNSLDIFSDAYSGIKFKTLYEGMKSSRLAITSNGNIGIGTESPSAVYWAGQTWPVAMHIISSSVDTARFESSQSKTRIRIGGYNNSGGYIESDETTIKIGITDAEVKTALGGTNLYPNSIEISKDKIISSVPFHVPLIPMMPTESTSKQYVDSIDALGSSVVLFGHRAPDSFMCEFDSDVPMDWIVQAGGIDSEEPANFSPNHTRVGLLRIELPEGAGRWSVIFTGTLGNWSAGYKGALGLCFVASGFVEPGSPITIGEGANILSSWHAICTKLS